jgi:putative hydrolase of the HAD superfamily
MTIRGIVFDIGGVLEITPKLGVTAEWERRLQLQPGELDRRLETVWEGGSLGKISEAEVGAAIQEIMGLAEADVKAMMDDMWREYLGTLNVELDDYFRGLRPRFQSPLSGKGSGGSRICSNGSIARAAGRAAHHLTASASPARFAASFTCSSSPSRVC